MLRVKRQKKCPRNGEVGTVGPHTQSSKIKNPTTTKNPIRKTGVWGTH